MRFYLPNHIRSIGAGAFSHCTSLKSIDLPTYLNNFGEHAFYSCISLKNVVIPDRVTEIADYAFYGCSGFTELTIPETVKSIGNGAFSDCINLQKLIFLAKNPGNIKNGAFDNCRIESVECEARWLPKFSGCIDYIETEPSSIDKYRNYFVGIIDSNGKYYLTNYELTVPTEIKLNFNNDKETASIKPYLMKGKTLQKSEINNF